jgi:hypothetical protein
MFAARRLDPAQQERAGKEATTAPALVERYEDEKGDGVPSRPPHERLRCDGRVEGAINRSTLA